MQRQALIVLYAAGGDYWENNANWKDAKPLGDWHGVTTDAAGNVIGLDLSHNGLWGEIPDELDELTQLRELDISGNFFWGDIPL